MYKFIDFASLFISLHRGGLGGDGLWGLVRFISSFLLQVNNKTYLFIVISRMIKKIKCPTIV